VAQKSDASQTQVQSACGDSSHSRVIVDADFAMESWRYNMGRIGAQQQLFENVMAKLVWVALARETGNGRSGKRVRRRPQSWRYQDENRVTHRKCSCASSTAKNTTRNLAQPLEGSFILPRQAVRRRERLDKTKSPSLEWTSLGYAGRKSGKLLTAAAEIPIAHVRGLVLQ